MKQYEVSAEDRNNCDGWGCGGWPGDPHDEEVDMKDDRRKRVVEIHTLNRFLWGSG
jgi:hypothetical protein